MSSLLQRGSTRFRKSCGSGFLAFRAPVGGALSHDRMADWGAADPTGLVFPFIDEESLAKVAGLAVGVEEVAQGGAALVDGIRKDLPDGDDEFSEAGF